MSSRKIIGVTVGTTINPESLREKLGLSDFTENDPTVPEWAKQPEKPSYEVEEIIGAASEELLMKQTTPITNLELDKILI